MERFVRLIRQQCKEARRACYGNLVNVRMEQGQDPHDYTFKLIEVRWRRNGMGERILDERFEDIVLQGLTDDYEFVEMTRFHSRNFGIDDLKQ